MKTALFGSIVAAMVVSSAAVVAQDATSARPSVVVASVGSAEDGDRGRYVGRVVADISVDLVARVEGFLEKQAYTDGGFVKTGDLLFVIEQGLYQADVDSAQADLEGAQATLKNSTVDLERQKVLLSKGDVPQSTVDSATAEVAADQASVDEAKASLETAKINLGYTEIRSPIDGRVSQAYVDVGNLVDSSTGTLATVNTVDPINVDFYVSEKALISDRERGLIGDDGTMLNAKLTLADGIEYGSVGKVTYVDTVVQESSDTIRLEATFENPKGVLVPGQFVHVTLSDAEPQKVLTVPQSAVQLDSKGHFVYVVDSDDKIERRDITLGNQLGTSWAVTSGLQKDEKVVVQGLQRVSPGDVVNATEQQQSAALHDNG